MEVMKLHGGNGIMLAQGLNSVPVGDSRMQWLFDGFETYCIVTDTVET